MTKQTTILVIGTLRVKCENDAINDPSCLHTIEFHPYVEFLQEEFKHCSSFHFNGSFIIDASANDKNKSVSNPFNTANHNKSRLFLSSSEMF